MPGTRFRRLALALVLAWPTTAQIIEPPKLYVPPTATSNSEWPQKGRTPQGPSSARDFAPDGTPLEKWRFEIQEPDVFRGAPIVGQGIAFLASNERIYARAAADGRAIWSQPIREPASTPVRVALLAHDDGALYAASNSQLSAYDAGTGRLRWALPLDRPVLRTTTGGRTTSFTSYYKSHPIVDKGRLYVNDSQGLQVVDLSNPSAGLQLLFAKQPLPGIPPSVAVDWFFETPRVVDGIVYLLGAQQYDLYAVDAASGALLWKESAGAGAGTDHPQVMVGNELVYVTSQKEVRALDRFSGRLRWDHRFSSTLLGIPVGLAGLNQRVYVLHSSCQLFAFDEITGQLIWQQALPRIAGRCNALSVSHNMLFVQVKASNTPSLPPVIQGVRDDGYGATFRWNLSVNESGQPAVASGLIFVGGQNGVLNGVVAPLGAGHRSFVALAPQGRVEYPTPPPTTRNPFVPILHIPEYFGTGSLPASGNEMDRLLTTKELLYLEQPLGEVVLRLEPYSDFGK